MIEKELQQLQVTGADFPTQEEVASQSAVDVLDDRTGADDLRAQARHGLFQSMETAMQAFLQPRLLVPIQRLALVQRLQVKQFADDGHRHLELDGEISQVPIQLPSESQEFVAVILE